MGYSNSDAEEAAKLSAFNELLQTNGFDENMIQITGQPIGVVNPDTEDFSIYFNKPVYDPVSKSINIIPLPDEEGVSSPPSGNHLITITVGTGIKSASGEGMAVPVAFSYQTNNLVVTKAYKASNVWAIHDPANDSRIESFFYQTAPSDRDRRLRKNADGRYEVTLYFTVSRSMSEIEDPMPNSLIITQIHHARLDGSSPVTTTGRVREIPYNDITLNEERDDQAGGIYRYMNVDTNSLGAFYYKAVYTFESGIESGVYRLAVQPYRDGIVDPDPWETAVAENRFVTVVIDELAPGGNPHLFLRGNTYNHTIGGNAIHGYTDEECMLTIAPNFYEVYDNSGFGRLPSQSNPIIPWTMDEQRNIQWQWQVYRDANNVFQSTGNNWLGFNESSQEIDISNLFWDYTDDTGSKPLPKYEDVIAGTVSGLEVVEIRVRFRDALGNISGWSEPVNRIIYTTEPNSMPVSNWSAVYDEGSNSISLRWTTPSVMKNGVRVDIEGNANRSFPIAGIGEKTYLISNVPRMMVSTGGTVTNAASYKIQITAFKDDNDTAGVELSAPIWIFNIPEMESTETDPIIGIETVTDFLAIGDSTSPYYGLGEANAHKKFVLAANNIELSSYTPIGAGDAAFTATFYGHGRMITVNSFAGSVIGLFGTTSGATIRDLRVRYSDNIPYTDPVYVTANYDLVANSINSALTNTSTSGGVSRAFANLPDALASITSTGSYTVTVCQNLTMPGRTTANIAVAGADITLVSNSTERTISLSSNGRMFHITAGSLTLGNNITLVGRSVGGNGNQNNNNSVVYVGNGTFTMLDGSKITGNTVTSTTISDAPVYTGANGTFNMRGGTITGNSGYRIGGLEAAGETNLEGGSITGNSGNGIGEIYLSVTSTSTNGNTLSGTFEAGDITLRNTNNAINIGTGWTGSIGTLNLEGSVSDWTNQAVLTGSLSADVISRVGLGRFTTYNVAISPTHYIGTEGTNLGRLVARE